MGVDMQLIQQIVGHSSITMVEHYRHVDLAEELGAMEAMGSALAARVLVLRI
jgi:site-specific recombinase XerD